MQAKKRIKINLMQKKATGLLLFQNQKKACTKTLAHNGKIHKYRPVINYISVQNEKILTSDINLTGSHLYRLSRHITKLNTPQ